MLTKLILDTTARNNSPPRAGMCVFVLGPLVDKANVDICIIQTL